MQKIFRISIAIIFSTILTGCAKPEPDRISGEFFRFTVNLTYKGEPLQIEYPAACKFNISRNIDGSHSVDGASLAPSVFGVETSDGGALVVKTPNFCDYSRAIDANEVPSNYNPLIVHYEDAKSPTFGLGYYAPEAFDSPLSVMKFESSNTVRITGEEFSDWRLENPNANWVTYERMNANRNIFKDEPWELGSKHMATVCRGAILFTAPEEFQPRLTQAWIDAGKPIYWVDNIINSEAWALETVDRFTPKERRRKTALFGKYPMHMYGYEGNKVRENIYPSDTDFDLNRTDAQGRPKARFLKNISNFYMRRDGIGTALRRSNINMLANLKGFVFCNSHDGNHIIYEDIKRSFGGIPGLYSLNGSELLGKEKNVNHYNYPLSPSIYTYYLDRFLIKNKEIKFYGMGDKL